MVTCSLYWTYTWSPNLVLFRSHTWKPVKLGSVSVLHLKASQTWFRSILTLESQSNLVLFRSYTWKSIKLGSNFAICLLTWTYSSLLVLLRIPAYLDLPLITSLVALWLYHACLLDWTYTSDTNLVGIWNSLKTLICLNYPLSPRRSFWSFYRVLDPIFFSTLLFQTRKHVLDARCHAMYDCAWMKRLSI